MVQTASALLITLKNLPIKLLYLSIDCTIYDSRFLPVNAHYQITDVILLHLLWHCIV